MRRQGMEGNGNGYGNGKIPNGRNGYSSWENGLARELYRFD